MNLSYALKTRSLIPPRGFAAKLPAGEVIRNNVWDHLQLELRRYYPTETPQQLDRRIDSDTCDELRLMGATSFYDVFYPSLREQGDVTFIQNTDLLPAPHCYNPGLIVINGKLVMCYRQHLDTSFSEICVTEIDWDTLKPVTLGLQRTLKIPKSFDNEDQEDSRMCWHNGQIVMSYTMWRRATMNGKWLYTPQVDIAIWSPEWKLQQKVTHLYRTNTLKPQKNWTYFSHNNRLMCCYDFNPHTVTEFSDSSESINEWETDGIEWDYGTIRGSTPPVRLSDDEYLSFFHSRKVDTGLPGKVRYYAGAYCFEAKEPFRITRFTEQPVFVGSEKDTQWDSQLACVFPCGLVLRDGVAYVSMGSNDMECVVARVAVPELLSKMRML